jgi:hypothetical protein
LPSAQPLNGSLAGTNDYLTNGPVTKVRVGTSVTSVQVEYLPFPKPPKPPRPQDDFYTMTNCALLTVSAPGVLVNDQQTNWPGLVAANVSTPQHGSLALNTNGGFSYTPNSKFFGIDCFTYEAQDASASFGRAAVGVLVWTNGAPFQDDFLRCGSNAWTWPWQLDMADWSVNTGVMQGQSSDYGYCHFGSGWSNCSVQASIQLPGGVWGGGLGGRLDPGTGAHYAAWIYPEGTTATDFPPKTLALVKFQTWQWWGYGGIQRVPMGQYSLSTMVSNLWHTLKLSFTTNRIDVYYDDLANAKISVVETNEATLSGGAVSLDLWGASMLVSNAVVSPHAP